VDTGSKIILHIKLKVEVGRLQHNPPKNKEKALPTAWLMSKPPLHTVYPSSVQGIWMKEIMTKPAGKNSQAQNEDEAGPVAGYRGGGAFLNSPEEQAEASPCTDKGRSNLDLGLVTHFQDPSTPQLSAE